MYLRWLPATNQYTPLSLVSRARGRTCVGFCNMISNRTLSAQKDFRAIRRDNARCTNVIFEPLYSSVFIY